MMIGLNRFDNGSGRFAVEKPGRSGTELVDVQRAFVLLQAYRHPEKLAQMLFR
jgi:hypothetical protein